MGAPMNLAAPAVSVLFVLLAPSPQLDLTATQLRRDAVKAELKTLEGWWDLIAAEKAGVKVPLDQLKDRHLVFRAGRLFTVDGRQKEVFNLRLDAAASPKSMQISHVEVFKNREFVTMVYQAIYRIDGDTLTLCFVYGPPGMRLARPTEFKTRQGQLTYLYTLKRRAR